MKHCYKLFAAALMVVLSTLILSGCNKNEDPANEALKQGEATLARIMDFKQKVDYYKANPAIKDGESVTLGEAIWNIESLFNLTYAYPELSYGRTETADTVLYLPVGSDNTVLLTDLTVFYGRMYEVISDIYHGIELDSKQFIILDVELGERHGNQQAIMLQSVQGSVKGIQPPTPQPVVWAPFADGPAWYYGEEGGMIDGNLDGEMDAADTLANMLNAILVPKAPAGQAYIYSDIIMKELQQEHHIPFTHNSYQGEYCEFYIQDAEGNDKWLNTSQMNFQYYGERYLVLNILPNYDGGDQSPVPTDFKMFNVSIEDYKIQTTIGHHTKAYYGQRETVYYNIVIKSNL